MQFLGFLSLLSSLGDFNSTWMTLSYCLLFLKWISYMLGVQLMLLYTLFAKQGVDRCCPFSLCNVLLFNFLPSICFIRVLVEVYYNLAVVSLVFILVSGFLLFYNPENFPKYDLSSHLNIDIDKWARGPYLSFELVEPIKLLFPEYSFYKIEPILTTGFEIECQRAWHYSSASPDLLSCSAPKTKTHVTLGWGPQYDHPNRS